MLSVARDLDGALAAGTTEHALIPDLAEIAIVTDPAAIEADWRAFDAVAVGHVFQSFDFLSPWLAHVGRERAISPRVVVGRDRAGEMLFLLPFGIRRCLGSWLLEWLGGEHADYHCGLYAPRFLAALGADTRLAGALQATVIGLFKGEADLVSFRRQPVEIAGLANPFAGFAAIPHSAMSHLTRLGGDWEAYYRAKRNSSSRRNDRSKRQKMEASGPVRFIDAETPAEVRRVTAALFSQKTESLAAQGIPNIFASPAVRGFYAALALKPFPRGPSHVAAIECGGEVVATNWGLVRGDRYYYVMHSYAGGEIGRTSPGRHLMYHLMQWCIARRIGLFDFTIGDEEFKSQWCEESTPLFDSVAALRARGAWMAATLRVGKYLKRTVKNNQTLWMLAGYVRRWRSMMVR